MPSGLEGDFLYPLDGQNENNMTPLRRATRIIDSQPSPDDTSGEAMATANSVSNVTEEDMWQASENISLLEKEQMLFEDFLHRICPWVCLCCPRILTGSNPRSTTA